MRKKGMISIIGAAGAAATTYMLVDKGKREKLKSKFSQMKSMSKNNDSNLPLEEAGNPSKASLENADMVAEGSQYGVQYYNKVKQ
ncbi:hypothetical protein [Gracilibacillus sp. YIM 98692]|uniref:hypothetical protein n=1 Tax=Gracilibacillus sp. YIM 98692 TaxID=2663532 RepID=UPI0013D614CB|nr:hypothetical protein [Gracilibacillus sp. YIM 98692]